VKHRSHAKPDSSSLYGSKGHGRYVKDRPGACTGGNGCDSSAKLMSMGTPHRWRKCNIYGHFMKECKTKPQGEEWQEPCTMPPLN
jgi:hypothetical protein